jgi:hypothetical protein
LDVSGQLHGPTALPTGKQLPVPTGYEAGWAPKPVWRLWKKEKYRPGIEPWPSNPQPVAIPTELSRLLFEHGKGTHENKGSKRRRISMRRRRRGII